MDRYFYLQNPWWENITFDTGIIRYNYVDQLEKSINQRLIQILTGLRRVGKSTIARQLVHLLINKKKVNPKKILFFSIEEPSISKTPIINIVNEFRSEHGIKSNTKIYVFIDEIQFRENWQQEIKSLYDTENIKFILTGSSAMLLSKKLSYLTGRYLKTQVFPLSFKEYLDFKKVKTIKVDRFLLAKHTESFFIDGGMPEYVLYKPDRYLQTTIESILFKDLVSKFKLRAPQILTELIYLLSDRVGSTSSSLKLSKILEINKDTVLTYLDYLNKTFITSELSNYSTSRNKEIYNPSKIYFEDTGVCNTYSSKTNYGALAENAIYNHLKKQLTEELRVKLGYWYENKNEIDFVIKKGNNKYLIESKWVDRIDEIKSFNVLEKLKSIKKIFYITRTLKSKITIYSHKVEFIPLHEFLIDNINVYIN
ncbi:ATP-binding protein [Patescibacteria group bacterium]|nr:ATP-binding protein [Patescibacteria group bacterium]